jgi:Zn-dependent peptidase ImmA (M78 family)/transcriptional regulator with XRE-family HTH domain
MANINSKMLILARQSRGFSQTDLALETQIPQERISRLENEAVITIKDEDFETICKVLNYPQSFFNQSINLYPPNVHYRKRTNIHQKVLQKSDALMNIYRIHLEKILESIDLSNEHVPIIDNENYDTPIKIAQFLRSYWNIPKGPIQDLTKLIESKGIVVVPFEFDSDKIDGRSMSMETGHFIIFINKNLSGDRARLTIAHELGHIIMHMKTIPTFARDEEKEAFTFGAELLLPIEELRNELSGRLTIQKLSDLKRIWKVSMQSMIYWAQTNELITPSHSKYLWSQISTQGWRKNEPINIPFEMPTLITRMIDMLKSEYGHSTEDMSKMFNINENEFKAKFEIKPVRPMLRIA